MKEIKLSSIIENPTNPRFIRDDKFEKLKISIEEFPRMLELRPIVVNDDMVIVGGNMRYKALQDLGYTKIPENWLKKASDFTPEELRKFIILDNSGFGEWDYDLLKQQYEVVELEAWGITVPHYEPVNPDDFFNSHEDDENKEETKKLILEYSESDFEKVSEAIEKLGNSPEQVIWKLLNLDE